LENPDFHKFRQECNTTLGNDFPWLTNLGIGIIIAAVLLFVGPKKLAVKV